MPGRGLTRRLRREWWGCRPEGDQYDAYEGRNSLRRSDTMITFTNGNYVQNGEETANRYVRMILTKELVLMLQSL